MAVQAVHCLTALSWHSYALPGGRNSPGGTGEDDQISGLSVRVVGQLYMRILGCTICTGLWSGEDDGRHFPFPWPLPCTSATAHVQ